MDNSFIILKYNGFSDHVEQRLPPSFQTISRLTMVWLGNNRYNELPETLADVLYIKLGNPCTKCYWKQAKSSENHSDNNFLLFLGEKPFKCSQCDMTFTRSSSLTRHQIIHSGNKPYQCKICSKGFNRNGNLKDHMFTHSKDKPYKCKICSREFVQSNKFKSHVQMHTGTSLDEWAMFNVNISDDTLRGSL